MTIFYYTKVDDCICNLVTYHYDQIHTYVDYQR